MTEPAELRSIIGCYRLTVLSDGDVLCVGDSYLVVGHGLDIKQFR